MTDRQQKHPNRSHGQASTGETHQNEPTRTPGRPGGRFHIPVLAAVLIAAAALRLYGLDWDSGHWLHPDERQIYFLAMGLAWPENLGQALSPGSPLNPDFFAYGSLPIYLVRLVAGLLSALFPALRDLDNLHWAGRSLAVLFDLGTVYLTYRLALALWPFTGLGAGARRASHDGRCPALLAAALVGLAVLHVQLAHFYTVDPLLTFFVLLALNLAAGVAQHGGRRRQAALGLALGLALATKASALPLLLVVLAACAAGRDGPEGAPHGMQDRAVAAGRCLLVSGLAAGIVFVVAQPYALIDWRAFLGDTLRESQIAWGVIDAPYTRQFAGTLPYLYPIRQTALWGLALPLGLLAWIALGVAVARWFQRGLWADTLLLAWAAPYVALTGLQYTRYPRYILPLVPAMCILAVWLLARIRLRWLRAAASGALVAVSLAFALALVSTYAAPHPWVAASEWIYEHTPAGSTLAVEDWDTALPLPLALNGLSRRIEEYDVGALALYDEPDDLGKWQALAAELASSDYVIVASRRLYGSIPRLPERYPVASLYHAALFSGQLGFEPAAEFTRGPAWLNPRLPPLFDPAPALLRPDESFVVYDHPRVLVYRNSEHFEQQELLGRLLAGTQD